LMPQRPPISPKWSTKVWMRGESCTTPVPIFLNLLK